MKGFKKTLVAGIAAGAVIAGSSTFATAADFAAPAPVATWTGLWIGAGVGYGFVNHELGAEAFIDEGEDFYVAGKADLSGIGGEGWMGQVGAGFDFQIGESFLIGIFGDYTFSDIKSSASAMGQICAGPGCIGPGEVYAKIKADSMWFVGGRAGYLANPDTLLYGLVGYTEVNFDATLGYEEYECDDDCTGSYKTDWSKGGLTFGGGVETKLSENITAKLEYRYIDLNTHNLIDGTLNGGEVGPNNPGVNAWVDSNLQTVTASVTWRFWSGL